jgi:hypothetical protein
MHLPYLYRPGSPHHLQMRWPRALVGGNDVGSGTLGSGIGPGVSVGTVMLIGIGKGEPFWRGNRGCQSQALRRLFRQWQR